MKVKGEREVAKSCPTLSDLVDCSLPGSSVHGIFQARVLEWGAIAFSEMFPWYLLILEESSSLSHSIVFLYFFALIMEKGFLIRVSAEKAMAPHSSTLAWKIPWREEPGRLQSMGSLRVRHH